MRVNGDEELGEEWEGGEGRGGVRGRRGVDDVRGRSGGGGVRKSEVQGWEE